MKNKILIFVCFLFLLTGCNTNNIDSSFVNSGDSSENVSEESSTNIDTSASEEDSSEEISSEESSSEESSEDNKEDIELNSIKEIKQYGLNFNSPNEIGITFTNKIVELTGLIVLAKDQVASNGLYGEINQYKALIIDNEDYMYLNIDYTFYSKNKDYQYKSTTIYKTKGEIINNNSIVEINVNEYTFLENSSLNYSFTSFYETIDFNNNYYEIINKLIINNRGCGLSDIVKIKAKYIMKLTNNNLLMYDGEKYFQLNGDDKIGNGFIIDTTYDILAIPNLYRYTPGIIYVDKKVSSSDIGNVDYTNINKLSSTDLYKIKYTKEVNTHSLNYEKTFETIYKFEGYINYYVKNDQINMVISDTYKSTYYSTYTTALNNKCAFINNDNEKGLYSDSDLLNSLTYEYALIDTKISFYYYPYLLNTSNYWMIYIISGIEIIE